ncbi:Ribulose-phosphate 3-epimerase [Lachnospiraceae bacterium TWA4]|nr:Ribulose-phosphate 3-epimerase [Lachnospiraceae bacterium TWA4]
MAILAPSILSADFSTLAQDVAAAEESGATYLHLDIMDGAFVPNISFGAGVISCLRPKSKMVFDVHMMVEEPSRFIDDFVKAGADIIVVHAEACKHLDRTLMQIKEAGIKCGVALNPATPLSILDYVYDLVDMIVLMSVNPGFGNQKFIPYTMTKLKQLRTILDEKELDVDIEIDGGVKLTNCKELIDLGATVLVAGSAVFKGDIRANTKAFLEII